MNPRNLAKKYGLTTAAEKLIDKIVHFDLEFPECLQDGMLDWLDVVANGAKKYEPNGWLKPDGARASRKEMHDSITHHRAESFVLGPNARDKDSGLHPNLHETCRSIMQYIRDKRGIKHPDDKENYGFLISEPEPFSTDNDIDIECED